MTDFHYRVLPYPAQKPLLVPRSHCVRAVYDISCPVGLDRGVDRCWDRPQGISGLRGIVGCWYGARHRQRGHCARCAAREGPRHSEVLRVRPGICAAKNLYASPKEMHIPHQRVTQYPSSTNKQKKEAKSTAASVLSPRGVKYNYHALRKTSMLILKQEPQLSA